MFFNSPEEIPKIALRAGTTIFVVPESLEIPIKNAYTLKPEEKTTITIEQVRKINQALNNKQTSDQYVVIRPADKLSLAASNALLKNLEEPGNKVHYLLITNQPSKLPATIKSRAQIYFYRTTFDIKTIENTDEDKKIIAKSLIVAKPHELVGIAKQITKQKTGVRDYSLEILEIAIEILTKTYMQTHKNNILVKLSKFITTYDNIASNGNIKLHLVADLC